MMQLHVLSRGTFDDHLQDVARVLHRFADWGLQLNVAKYAFFAKEVKCLGHIMIISTEGIKMGLHRGERVAESVDKPEQCSKLWSAGHGSLPSRWCRGQACANGDNEDNDNDACAKWTAKKTDSAKWQMQKPYAKSQGCK